ncbi:MAG: hypothetical protein ICV73_01550 [Acetobacteraceae bacterium]|nr:hypothetical protein [Acetobacteraceae bacterium]
MSDQTESGATDWGAGAGPMRQQQPEQRQQQVQQPPPQPPPPPLSDNPGPTQDPDWLEESLVAPSAVRLFGRPFAALTIEPNSQALFDRNQRAGGGASPFRNPLVDKLDPTNEPAPRLARIFGFSFEGHYFALRAPALFLVHGEGIPVQTGDAIAFQQIGVAYKEQTFANNLHLWLYDRSDMTVRLDIGTGTLQEMLIDPESGGTARRRMDLVGLESGNWGRSPRGSCG